MTDTLGIAIEEMIFDDAMIVGLTALVAAATTGLVVLAGYVIKNLSRG